MAAFQVGMVSNVNSKSIRALRIVHNNLKVVVRISGMSIRIHVSYKGHFSPPSPP